MDPKVLEAWLIEKGYDPLTAETLAQVLCEEFVLRRRQPPVSDGPYRHKWDDPIIRQRPGNQL